MISVERTVKAKVTLLLIRRLPESLGTLGIVTVPIGSTLLFVAVILGHGLPLSLTEPPDSVGFFLAAATISLLVIVWWLRLKRPFSIATRFGERKRRIEFIDLIITWLGLGLCMSAPFVLVSILSTRTAGLIGTDDVIAHANSYQIGTAYGYLQPFLLETTQLQSRLWGWQFVSIPGARAAPNDKFGPILTGKGKQRISSETIGSGDSAGIERQVAGFCRTLDTFGGTGEKPICGIRIPNESAIIVHLLKSAAGTLPDKERIQLYKVYNAIPHEAVIRNLGRILLAKGLLEYKPLYTSTLIHAVAISIVLYLGLLISLGGSKAIVTMTSICGRGILPTTIGLMLCDWVFVRLRFPTAGKHWIYVLCFAIIYMLALLLNSEKRHSRLAIICLPIAAFLTGLVAVAIVTCIYLVTYRQGFAMAEQAFPRWGYYLVADLADPRLAVMLSLAFPWLRDFVLTDLSAPADP